MRKALAAPTSPEPTPPVSYASLSWQQKSKFDLDERYGEKWEENSLELKGKDAAEIFEDMTNQGVARDVLVYNTMISAALHHSRDEMALCLLKRMEEEACSPNVETYAPLLKMCCHKKKMKLLGILLHHMVKNDVSIDVATYILLIRGLCMSGKVEEACLFFEEAVRKGMVPRDSTCKMLVEELEKKGMAEAKLKIHTLVQSKAMANSRSPLSAA